MPLLQHVVQELDRELARLQAIRAIVAGLAQTPATLCKFLSTPAPVGQAMAPATKKPQPLESSSKPERKHRIAAGMQRRPRTPKRTAESRALTSAIPGGPVVFNPAKLAAEQAKRQQGREEQRSAASTPVLEDLDTLARSMAARWGTALVQ